MTDITTCNVCSSSISREILQLSCGNFDGSTLYREINLHCCSKCGHIFNVLNEIDLQGLISYYDVEYAKINIASTEKKGDMPGSKNIYTLQRYEQLFLLFNNMVSTDAVCLDIGCASGGFLNHLSGNGFKNLYGIELTDSYVDLAQKEYPYFTIKNGSADAIPFKDDFFDILVMDQVLEHVFNPEKVFSEAQRVLKTGGYFCIGVPDSGRYGEFFFFDYFWFLMREHIQHFDIHHLAFLAQKYGFELNTFNTSNMVMMSEKMVLPNLNAVFQLKQKLPLKQQQDNELFQLEKSITQYLSVEKSRMDSKRRYFKRLKLEPYPIYIWGVGRELQLLYEQTEISSLNIHTLIDSNKFKQENHTLDGHKISDALILKKASPDSILLVTAVAHFDSISQAARELDYCGRIINIGEIDDCF